MQNYAYILTSHGLNSKKLIDGVHSTTLSCASVIDSSLLRSDIRQLRIEWVTRDERLHVIGVHSGASCPLNCFFVAWRRRSIHTVSVKYRISGWRCFQGWGRRAAR
ncbi:unnamed protein product [Haemonchus placei]|uniref:Neur_chan_LBD domain-containing protein n=1 Tax=Haemonchus placei TaxID=6290 RepID=A0A0N4WMH8_HAEPC|nr:unnamed protein product [Haemonchus placei]